MPRQERRNERSGRSSKLNIGILFFVVIFFYLCVYLFSYFRTNHIVRYEVREGSLAVERIYRGVIIRKEKVMETQAAGYVNYYAREGERVAKNSLVYIVDETGRLAENMEAISMGENTLSNKDLEEFRGEIISYVHEFSPTSYDTVYDSKYALKNSVLKLTNVSMLDSIRDLNDSVGTNVINYSYAPMTGIVSYWVDGLEDLTPDTVTADLFDEKNDKYVKDQKFTNTLMATGDSAYKLSLSENWSIVLPIDAEYGAELEAEDYIKVRFLKNRLESWAKVKLLHNPDGNTYLQLDFNNSMITFVSDRFLDIELIVEDESGLKIPVSSIATREFFLIPERFVDAQSNSKCNVMRQCVLEDGSVSSELLEIEIYNFDKENGDYYLDSSILSPGDILYKADGQETYTVSRRATLIGVYNMNKGYADFKQINILYQNDEYAIVKSNTQYGLNVYDYIVLDADSVSNNQFVK